MLSLPKVIGIISCGFLLYLGPFTAAQANNAASTEDILKADQSDRRQGAQEAGEKQMKDSDREDNQVRGNKTVKGEVLRVEGTDCFIKGQAGKEVRLHIDVTTMKARNIEPGERIEAKVDDRNHVIAILSDPAVTDRRNDKE